MTANTPPDTVRQVKCHNLYQFDFEKTDRSLHHFTSHTTFGMLLETVRSFETWNHLRRIMSLHKPYIEGIGSIHQSISDSLTGSGLLRLVLFRRLHGSLFVLSSKSMHHPLGFSTTDALEILGHVLRGCHFFP